MTSPSPQPFRRLHPIRRIRFVNERVRTTTPPPPRQQPPGPLHVLTRVAIHEAFEHVALGMACTLPMLLQETRRRGVADNDVRRLLSEEETEMACRQGTEMHFQCFRSRAGVFYVTRDTGPRNRLASAAEGFAEL